MARFEAGSAAPQDGTYKSFCCGSEKQFRKGAKLPACPMCRRPDTEWTLRSSTRTGKKSGGSGGG